MSITSVNDFCTKQYFWVERMGWHNKTVLEALALIASEVGEAVNECRGDEPTDAFGEELADICERYTLSINTPSTKKLTVIGGESAFPTL